MMENIFKDLDDFLIYANEENTPSGQWTSNFTIRKGALIYYRKQAKFKQYVEKLYCDLKIKDLSVSRKYFVDAVIDYYIDCKRGDVSADIVKTLKQMELNTVHVFLPIYFIQIENNYVKIGDINFVKFQSLKDYASDNNLYVSNDIDRILVDKNFGNVPFVDCVIDVRDNDFAKEQAQIRLIEIINVLNFIIYSHIRGVETFSAISNYGTIDRTFIFSSKNANISINTHPSLIKRITIDEIREFLLGEGKIYINLFDQLTNNNRSEIDNRIVNAINWIGMAVAEKENSVAFTQAMYGIESLLQYEQKGEMISKSIVASIAENIAFLLGRNFDERKEFEKQFKKLYGIRSKIAHGKSNDVSAYDVLDVIGLAKSLVMSFYEIPSLKEAKTMKMVLNYIAKLKYSCLDDKLQEANEVN